MRASRTQIGFGALLACALVACGESRQEKFEKAMQSAEVARRSLDSAREEFASRELEYEKARAAEQEAESELATSRQKLDAATNTWESARVEVAKWADDASVSRVLQQELLAEPALEAAALSARVEQGVAILEGNVPDAAASERAVAIAREIPGVADVQSRIAIAAPAPAPAPIEAPSPEPTPDPAAIEDVTPSEMPTEAAH